jgi:hypothetical protein
MEDPSGGSPQFILSPNTSVRVVGEPLSLLDKGDRLKPVQCMSIWSFLVETVHVPAHGWTLDAGMSVFAFTVTNW